MAISLVQSKSGTWSSPSVSLNSNTTAGNCVVLMITDTGSGVTATSAAKLGGSAGNFTKLQELSTTPASIHVLASIWADWGCAGGQTAITWTDTGSPSLSTYWIAEFSGVSAVSASDTGNQASGSAGSWSTTFTSTVATELWLGVLADSTGGTGAGSAGHGWTFITQADAASNVCVYGWQAVSSTGTATWSGTGGSSKGWGIAAAGLKGASTPFMPDPNNGPNQAVMRSAVW